MRRPLYLSALVVLQLALIAKLTPPLALALRVEASPGLAPGDWPVMLQLVATAAAIAGTSLTLVFPGVALARHRRGGALRFAGMPRWAVTLALTGAALLAAGTVADALVPVFPADAGLVALLIARPVVAGGIALAAAGVLCAELMRSGNAPGHAPTAAARVYPGRIEVTHPPELRTHRS